MSGEMEAPHVYEDMQLEGRQNKMAQNKPQKRWVVPVAVVAGAIFAAVCFGVGFAIAKYYAVPKAGRYLHVGVTATEYIGVLQVTGLTTLGLR